MIVIGTDTHKKTHTCGAVDALTAAVRGELTVPARNGSFGKLLRWARKLDSERVWAIEDCRHVSGALERFLLARGEQIVRVAPKHMAGARRSSRERGKSDSIDAFSVARAALKEGIENLPGAHLDGAALDIRLLVDHREDLIHSRTGDQQRLRWHLHDLWPELEIPAGALDTAKWLGKASRRLARAKQTTRVRVARELVRQITARTTRIRELEAELTTLVQSYAPQMLEERGCGPLTAAKLIGEIAGADRFATDAKLARTSGAAPIPASSGNTHRHRLDRGGNRQLNCALHRLAVNKARYCPKTAAYLARKQAEGKTRKEALRCLKRILARRVWQLMRSPTTEEPAPAETAIPERPKARETVTAEATPYPIACVT
ncbi:MAG: IS110 family RNA-guided transposase [Solirubrobacteraceae bacterium]